MKSDRSWRLAFTVAVSALLAAIPMMITNSTTTELAAPAEPAVCVFYGICAGPTLPGR